MNLEHGTEHDTAGSGEGVLKRRQQAEYVFQGDNGIDSLLHERHVGIFRYDDTLVDRPFHIDKTREDFLRLNKRRKDHHPSTGSSTAFVNDSSAKVFTH